MQTLEHQPASAPEQQHALRSCKGCARDLPLDEFYVVNRTAGRLDTKCKTCRKAMNRAYRIANSETVREQKRDHYRKNSERIRARMRQTWIESPCSHCGVLHMRQSTKPKREGNPGRVFCSRACMYSGLGGDPSTREERKREYRQGYYQARKVEWAKKSKTWVQQNPEKRREIERRYKERNADRLREARRRYFLDNREAILDRQRQARKKSPEKGAANAARRRARVLGAPVVEAFDRAYIIERDKRTCHICGKRVLKREALHIDHIIPLSRGGEHSAANVAVAHASCNQRKWVNAANDQLRLIG